MENVAEVPVTVVVDIGAEWVTVDVNVVVPDTDNVPEMIVFVTVKAPPEILPEIVEDVAERLPDADKLPLITVPDNTLGPATERFESVIAVPTMFIFP